MLYIIGKNLPDKKLVRIGLSIIYGIGPNSAKAICDKFNINDKIRFKDLNDRQKTLLGKTLSDMFLEGRLRKEKKMHIRRLIIIKSYRGFRHKAGLPVRGQRTHTNAQTMKKLSNLKIN
jgi:small subunit ribosomal protein S13